MIYALNMILFTLGLVIMIRESNLIKKVIGLNIFQSSIFIFILLSKLNDSLPPILEDYNYDYSNPLPHVLILTAIVVSISTTSLALALILKIKKQFNTIDEDEISKRRSMNQIPVLILILPLLFVPIIILMRMFKVSYLIIVVSSVVKFSSNNNTSYKRLYKWGCFLRIGWLATTSRD